MVLSDIRQGKDAGIAAQRVIKVLAHPFVLEGKEVYISASMGISTHPIDGDNPTTLLKNADAAMYHAKKQGKNGHPSLATESSLHFLYLRKMAIRYPSH
jgi:diguanylate cyclase (GGDEF)-like protein